MSKSTDFSTGYFTQTDEKDLPEMTYKKIDNGRQEMGLLMFIRELVIITTKLGDDDN